MKIFNIRKKVLIKLNPIIKIFIIFMVPISCTDTSTGPVTGKLEFFGFKEKFALRMVLEEPYLYVCAGSDGVWKRNINEITAQWQYLSLKDTSLGTYSNVGALDIDVLEKDILVAYNGSSPHISPDSSIAVWRSIDSGINWFRSDSGIPQSKKYHGEFNIVNSLQRSPHQQDIVIAVYGPAIYRSVDGGEIWNFSGTKGVFVNKDFVRWNPFQPGEIWFFGETALFSAYCFGMRNYGTEIKTVVNFDSLGYPADDAVYDLAFDAGNPNIIYAATSLGVIKTTDGGFTWENKAIKIPNNNFVFRMAFHLEIPGILFLAGGKRVFLTKDGGKLVKMIGEIEQGSITSLLLDSKRNQLFVGTTEGGIYTLKLSGW